MMLLCIRNYGFCGNNFFWHSNQTRFHGIQRTFFVSHFLCEYDINIPLLIDVVKNRNKIWISRFIANRDKEMININLKIFLYWDMKLSRIALYFWNMINLIILWDEIYNINSRISSSIYLYDSKCNIILLFVFVHAL